jgi:hypothetical protein
MADNCNTLTPALQDAEFSEARRFMPGACGPEGEAAALFAASDRQDDPLAPALALAQAACGDCIQRQHCGNQQRDISKTLFAMGVGIPVVGAEIAQGLDHELDYATTRELLPLVPHYTFDLSKPLPRDGETAAVILRQMVRANRRLLAGVRSKVSDWAID